MVRASTISTAHARKTAPTRTRTPDDTVVANTILRLFLCVHDETRYGIKHYFDAVAAFKTVDCVDLGQGLFVTHFHHVFVPATVIGNVADHTGRSRRRRLGSQSDPGGAHEEMRILIVRTVLGLGRLDRDVRSEWKLHFDSLRADLAHVVQRELPGDTGEPRHKGVLGVTIDLLGSRVLHEFAVSQHPHAIGQSESLRLVVSD